MPARQAVLRWVRGNGLPALITLLVALACGTTTVAATHRHAGPEAGAALDGAIAPQPSAGMTSRDGPGLLPERGGRWASGTSFVAWHTREYRPSVPAGRWIARDGAAVAHRSVR